MITIILIIVFSTDTAHNHHFFSTANNYNEYIYNSENTSNKIIKWLLLQLLDLTL